MKPSNIYAFFLYSICSERVASCQLPLYLNLEWLKFSVFFECIFCIILVVILLNSFFAIFAKQRSLVKITLLSCEKIFINPCAARKRAAPLPLGQSTEAPLFNITTLLLAFNSFRHIHSAFRYNGIEALMEFFWAPTFVFQLNMLVWSVYLSLLM